MCEDICIGNTQQKFKKIMDGNFSDLLCLLKNRQKYDSFDAHFEQHSKYTTSKTDLHKCMSFKLAKNLNTTGSIKMFMQSNCNLYMEERLTIIKNLSDKPVTFMNNNLEICEACRNKAALHRFCLSTDGPV